jgi:hypothetical protein
VVQFSQLGFDGRSLTDDFASPLHGLALGVNLLNMGSHLFLLLMGLLLLRREPGVWFWYGRP